MVVPAQLAGKFFLAVGVSGLALALVLWLIILRVKRRYSEGRQALQQLRAQVREMELAPLPAAKLEE